MELLDATKRPVITEKSILAMNEREYTFEVDTHTNKILVKQAIESTFDVKITNINILDVHPKFKHMGKYAGYTKKCRKAIVTLTEDSRGVQLFGAAE